MKKGKLLAVAGVTMLSAAFLVACGKSDSKSSGEASTYSYVYTEDPVSLDYVAYNRQQVSDVATKLVDGMLEYDKYGNIKPSLAEDWKVSADGKTYTYTLRDGLKWYTNEGEEYGDVKAEDFVTSLKHAVDTKSEGLYLIQGSIAGLDDYVNGKTKDFSTVGVKALDDKTVQYTLNNPEPYWNSKMTMAIMLPISTDFLKAKGDDFGKPQPDAILSNGPYFLSSMTSKSAMEFTKNEDYWDADNVKISDIKLTYYDGQDPESLIKGYEDGNYTSARVFPNTSTYSHVKEKYGENITFSQQQSSTYFYYFNVNRSNYGHTSKKSDAEKTSTQKALQNKTFRQALTFGFNREAYLAQSVGEDGATYALRNMMTPTGFVSANGSDYTELVQKDIEALGDTWKGVKFDQAANGVYSKDKAKAAIEAAKAELSKDGVSFPVHLDMPVNQSSKVGVAQAQSMKQSIEEAVGSDNVVIDLQMMDDDTFSNAVYYAESTDQNDYDIAYGGWGPDYQDPSSYLDIFETTKGANISHLGIDASKDQALIKQLGLDQYDQMLADANAETSDTAKRYEKYAQAEAWLLDSALVVPFQGLGGSPSVSNVKPTTGAYSMVGIKDFNSGYYKGAEMGTEANKESDVLAARKKWEEERKKSNEEAEKELASHVEK